MVLICYFLYNKLDLVDVCNPKDQLMCQMLASSDVCLGQRFLDDTCGSRAQRELQKTQFSYFSS